MINVSYGLYSLLNVYHTSYRFIFYKSSFSLSSWGVCVSVISEGAIKHSIGMQRCSFNIYVESLLILWCVASYAGNNAYIQGTHHVFYAVCTPECFKAWTSGFMEIIPRMPSPLYGGQIGNDVLWSAWVNRAGLAGYSIAFARDYRAPYRRYTCMGDSLMSSKQVAGNYTLLLKAPPYIQMSCLIIY